MNNTLAHTTVPIAEASLFVNKAHKDCILVVIDKY